MKCLVIGLCPYLVTARSKVTAMVMEHLIANGHQVAGAVYGHDPQFFIPEQTPQGERHFYKFGEPQHKVPLNLFSHREKTPIAVYEIIRALQPEVVITIGDHKDHLYMRAVKMFEKNFRWINILTNYHAPISSENAELFEDVDGVLCASRFSAKSIEQLFKKDLLRTAFVGSSSIFQPMDRESIREQKKIGNKFRIMTCNKIAQSDQLAALVESVAEARKEAPDIELYLHSNVYDTGDYDLHQLMDKFDPNDEFIILPEKYVSVFEGISDKELAEEMTAADLFVSISMTAGTSMSIFESVACGCYPLMTACGSHVDVAEELAGHLQLVLPEEFYSTESFLVPCTRLMERDGGYLSICDPIVLTDRILTIYRNRTKFEGHRTQFAEFRYNRWRERFLESLSWMLAEVPETNTVCLETVKGD